MVNPQKENGFTPISNEILDELVKLRIPASEKDVLFFVVRKTYGYQKKEDKIPLSQFEKGTGLSRVTVVKALKNLVSRNILIKKELVKSGIPLYSLNKHHDLWVVNPTILVKSENVFGKPHYTESGKPHYTLKRKKEKTKETPESKNQSTEIPTLIKAFEGVNPACSKFYGNPVQRRACEDLIKSYGFDRVLTVIEKTLPKTNGLQYFPSITTPLQLNDKWASLESAVLRHQSKKLENKTKVAFC